MLDQRSFQLAFRRLRQMTTRQDGPMDVLNLDRTIDETCNNAGYLQLEFDRPRTNDIKVMVLFDSGGSMTPYARLCSQLFQAVNRANNFKDLKIFYFHNCWYSELYTGPRCVYGGVGADPVGHQQPQPGLQGHRGGRCLHGPPRS